MGDDDESAPRPLATRSAAFPTSRLGAPIDLVDLAAEIQRADAALSVHTSGKLELLREQMRALADQARAILEQAETAARLHRARCAFQKIPGRVYHLYRAASDDLYFSMLSPDDWGGSPPHPHEGSFRLEPDQTFTRVHPTEPR